MLSGLWAGGCKSEDRRGEELGVTHGHQLTSLQEDRERGIKESCKYVLMLQASGEVKLTLTQGKRWSLKFINYDIKNEGDYCFFRDSTFHHKTMFCGLC